MNTQHILIYIIVLAASNVGTFVITKTNMTTSSEMASQTDIKLEIPPCNCIEKEKTKEQISNTKVGNERSY